MDEKAAQKCGGLLHIYTGNGKGKTTAAIGLCVRCVGSGKRVIFSQFLKGRPTGELEPLLRLGVETWRTEPVVKFFKSMDESERGQCIQSCRSLFERCKTALATAEIGLLVLDEVLDVVNLGILSEDELCGALTERGSMVEVVLTGRNPGNKLCAIADYISEIKSVRHPYDNGITARSGIEY